MKCSIFSAAITPLKLPLLLAAFIAGWSGIAGTHGATPAAKGPPVIAAPAKGDASNFFRSPDFTAPAVSPDGKSVAFIALQNEHACLFRLNLATGKIEGVFDPGDGQVECCWWLGSQRLLFAAIGASGRSFFIQDLNGSKPRVLPTLEHLPLEWIWPIAGDPDHIMAIKFDSDSLPWIASERGSKPWTDIYVARVDLMRGTVQHLDMLERDEISSVLSRDPAAQMFANEAPESGHNAVFSTSGELRAKTAIVPGQWHVMWRAEKKQPWHEARSHNSRPAFVPLAMARDDHHLVVIAYDQGDTSALMLLDPDTDQRTLLAQRPDRDVQQLIWAPSRRYAVGGTFFNYGPEDAEIFDSAARNDYASLQRALPATTNRVISSSDDGSIRIVAAWGPSVPPRYFLDDRANSRLSLLGQEQAQLETHALGRMKYFRYTTRDGITESGCILLPPSSDATKQFPLFVLPLQHLGENPPVVTRFCTAEQYLAGRGLAVAHFGVRGSAGFGQAFQKAGNFEMLGKIPHDLEDGIRQLQKENVVAPGKIAIIGIGVSGLCALRTAADSTDIRAVVILNAPASPRVSDVAWMTDSTASTTHIIDSIGGPKEALRLVQPFEPGTFLDRLAASTLLIEYTWFDGQRWTRSDESGLRRDTFERRHLSCEFRTMDWENGKNDTMDYRSAQLFKVIADYLTKNLQ